jgi:thiol-disulfide isomerase/thioredoxin
MIKSELMIIVHKIFFIVLIGIIACNGKKNIPSAPEEQGELQLNKILLKDLKGGPLSLGQYKGKTVFINFWATWCKPCLEEMPYIKKVMELLKGKEIVFLFASDETPEEIENFKNDHDYPFNYVRVENSVELNIMGLPTTFIFNPGGKLVFSDMGFRKWDADENIKIILNPEK